MNVEESLYKRLSTYAGLTALIGTRVHPAMLPQPAVLPAVTYQLIGGSPVAEMGGAAHASLRLYQVTAWGETYTSAKGVAAQVLACLDGFGGQLGGTGGVQAFVGQVSEGRDLIDPETGWAYIPVDYEVFYQR